MAVKPKAEAAADKHQIVPGAGPIIPGTAEWDAWREFKLSPANPHPKERSTAYMDRVGRMDDPDMMFWVRSRWPPGHQNYGQSWPDGDHEFYRKVLRARNEDKRARLRMIPLEERQAAADNFRRAIRRMDVT